MNLYRFSPTQTEEALFDAIKYIHFESHKLCKNSFGKYLPNAGNVGVFCHYPDEYRYLTSVREKLTEASENFNQKYFRLHNPIVIPAEGDVPETTYEFLYIRQPDPYRHHVGDIDFYLEETEYAGLKKRIEGGEAIPGARIFPAPRLDMIELFDPDSDVLAYVSTKKMTDLVKITKSGA